MNVFPHPEISNDLFFINLSSALSSKGKQTGLMNSVNSGTFSANLISAMSFLSVLLLYFSWVISFSTGKSKGFGAQNSPLSSVWQSMSESKLTSPRRTTDLKN